MEHPLWNPTDPAPPPTFDIFIGENSTRQVKNQIAIYLSRKITKGGSHFHFQIHI
jgi:hypothetical protein